MKPLFKSKISLWASVLALVVIIGVGATLALMASPSNSVTNSFSAADIDTEIEENLAGGNKEVSIHNYGPSDAYVRARIMVSGVNPENVEIVSQEPAKETVEANPNTVYLVMKNNGSAVKQWTKKDSDNNTYSDDFYYYLGVLEANNPSKNSSANLLDKVVLGETLAADEDFLKNDFSVTIYHESVLAIDKTANLATVKAAFDAAQPNL